MATCRRFILPCIVFFLSIQVHHVNLVQRTLPVPKSCPEGFEGPTCQKQNVALRKNATSSSHNTNEWTADKAVDGDKRQMVSSNSCFHSNETETSPWWSVDLVDVFPMNNIVIYYRNEGAGNTLQRFITARILVANTTGEMLCATVTQSDAENAMKSNGVFRFNCSMSASKLILRHGDNCRIQCILEPCEIQVFECTAGFLGQECDQSCIGGWYGKGCAFQCGNCKEGTVCRNTDGLCLQGCRPGWQRDLCKEECVRGTYGQNCSGQCGQCSDGVNCHHVNGSCLSGICLPGFREHKCDETCSHGTYGQGCNSKCGHCTNDSYCHHVNGSCLNGICQPGYTGDRCDQECNHGTYGHDCRGQCGHCSDGATCHHVNGSCLSGSCQPGYMEEKCAEQCLNGTYGQNCSGQCGFCSDGAKCHHIHGSCLSGSCQTGYEGDKCDKVVSGQAGNGGGDSSGAVIGGVVAAMLVVLAVAGVLVVRYFRRKGQGESTCTGKTRTTTSAGKGAGDAGDAYTNAAFQPDAAGPSQEGGSHSEGSVASSLIAQVYANVSALPGVADVKSPSCVSTAKLEHFVATKKANGILAKEYKGVSGSFLAPHEVSQQKEHSSKNKFKGYYPYDFNRVVLEPTAVDPHSHYINASFIDGYTKKSIFIAAQAPTPVTLPDFLRMIWQQKCCHVVMLTNLVEEMKVKCVRYWPETTGEELKRGKVTVTLSQMTEWSYCTLRLLTLTHENGESLSVKQFHFTTWPDHGVPSHVDMLDFFWKVRASWTPDSGPLLVHCSAGVGRTGTFIALCILSDQAASQHRVDPLATLTALRHQRRNMIQTLPQYEFLHEALVRVVQLGRTAVDKEVFCSHFPSKKGGLLVGNCTLDQLAQYIPKICTAKKQTEKEASLYTNHTKWDYLENSFALPSTATKRGFEMVKLSESGTDALAPTGLWNFLQQIQACAIVDLHRKQSLVHESSQEDGRVDVVWRTPPSLEAGLTSRHLTLRCQGIPDVKVKYISLDVTTAQMPGCLAGVASRLASDKLSTSCPVVLLYRPSEESCAQLLCAAVNLAESLRLDGHVELVNSLLRLQTSLDTSMVHNMAEVAFGILHDDGSVYSNA